MLLIESRRERGKASEPGIRQCVSGMRRRIRHDVLATLSLYPPRLPNSRASYLTVRSARRVLWNLFHFRLSSSEAPSTEEGTKPKKDTAELEQLKEPQNNEGKTPGMSSATRLVSPRRGGVLEGELGPYIPTSPVKDLSARIVAEARPIAVVNFAQSGTPGQRSDSTARNAGATGEARFGDAESLDEWRAPFPVLGVAAKLADELTTPAPVFQLERNQLDLSRDSTVGEMIPAGAELMETAELNMNSGRVRPLVDVSLDTEEDNLHQTTGSSEAQTTGSTGYQTTGNDEARTAESSEVATTVVPVEHASTRAVVYPNSKSVDRPIIIENNN